MSVPTEPPRQVLDGVGSEVNPPGATDGHGDEHPAPARPGDPAALQRGCRCPTLANRPEAGDSLRALIAPDCPMHYRTPSSEGSARTRRGPSAEQGGGVEGALDDAAGQL